MLKLFLVFLFLAIQVEAKNISRTQVIMSTFIHISLEEQDKDYLQKGFNIVKAVDASLSSYNPKSKIFKLNQDKNITLDKYSHEALILSKKYYKKTHGYFDVTIGSITKDLYRFGEDERVPTNSDLLKAKISLSSLKIKKNKVSIEDGIKVDLGGMGKGFAVGKVAKFYRENHVKNAVIAASGDIRCLSICDIQVKNPFEDAHLVSFETTKNNLGISTSGNYNRYVNSTKNNHLINPKSKKSQTKFISITLIGGLASADLDAYATASSVMPLVLAYKFLDSLDVGYIVLQSDKKLLISKNISKYTKNLVVNYTMKK